LANPRAEEIAHKLLAARADTLRLFDLAREQDLHLSPGFGLRPIIWHLAHIGVFEAYWIYRRMKGENTPDERYERIFDPIHTPREESKNLPSRSEMESYLARVREGTLSYLFEVSFEDSNPLLRDGYIFQLILEHEYQHQETLAYLFHLLSPEKKTRPLIEELDQVSFLSKRELAKTEPPHDMLTIPTGPFPLGAVSNGFVYDNELPAHTVELAAFKIARLLTTNEEYADFIASGGYERREFWSDEGWAFREQENWTSPLYWKRDGKCWRVQTMFEEEELKPDHPVTGVSWYEAEAYTRFRGLRLPTEAEWEKAASWNPARERKQKFGSNDTPPAPFSLNFDFRYWSTTPVGSFSASASPYGCLDMLGNLWEWTNDPFSGYPGFEAFPYTEYSQLWFDGDHRVLKGGSWATRAPILRVSFRNFFRRHFRLGFAGLRCAADT
jgi:iron(II)-dependent oxidoreductase